MKKIVTTLFCAMAMYFTVACNAADMETVAVIGTGDMGDSLGPRIRRTGLPCGLRLAHSRKRQGQSACQENRGKRIGNHPRWQPRSKVTSCYCWCPGHQWKPLPRISATWKARLLSMCLCPWSRETTGIRVTCCKHRVRK